MASLRCALEYAPLDLFCDQMSCHIVRICTVFHLCVDSDVLSNYVIDWILGHNTWEGKKCCKIIGNKWNNVSLADWLTLTCKHTPCISNESFCANSSCLELKTSGRIRHTTHVHFVHSRNACWVYDFEAMKMFPTFCCTHHRYTMLSVDDRGMLLCKSLFFVFVVLVWS